ncbi:hypothetical protein L910_2992 [Vibrio fluvialis PG41]|uniref:Uncharacterized protein n=1 Tax=Vibrio fluvialis PG41 TaxID=1336752 RepID=S7I7W8_VIBFL|nr:hypothetical protein L910_2992 [Vibrio fluvialis PG41]
MVLCVEAPVVFLSCLYGSELVARRLMTVFIFLSCLYGSEQLYG